MGGVKYMMHIISNEVLPFLIFMSQTSVLIQVQRQGYLVPATSRPIVAIPKRKRGNVHIYREGFAHIKQLQRSRAEVRLVLARLNHLSLRSQGFTWLYSFLQKHWPPR